MIRIGDQMAYTTVGNSHEAKCTLPAANARFESNESYSQFHLQCSIKEWKRDQIKNCYLPLAI